MIYVSTKAGVGGFLSWPDILRNSYSTLLKNQLNYVLWCLNFVSKWKSKWGGFRLLFINKLPNPSKTKQNHVNWILSLFPFFNPGISNTTNILIWYVMHIYICTSVPMMHSVCMIKIILSYVYHFDTLLINFPYLGVLYAFLFLTGNPLWMQI